MIDCLMARCHCVTQMISGIKNYPAHRHNSSLYCSVFKERVARCDFDILANILLSVKRFSEINFSRPRRHLGDVGYLTTLFPLCQHFFKNFFCCALFLSKMPDLRCHSALFCGAGPRLIRRQHGILGEMDFAPPPFSIFCNLCHIVLYMYGHTTALCSSLQMFCYRKKSILHFMKKAAIYIYTFQFTSAIINIKKLIGISWR